jgi:hypothetical protein
MMSIMPRIYIGEECHWNNGGNRGRVQRVVERLVEIVEEVVKDDSCVPIFPEFSPFGVIKSRMDSLHWKNKLRK